MAGQGLVWQDNDGGYPQKRMNRRQPKKSRLGYRALKLLGLLFRKNFKINSRLAGYIYL